MSIFKRFLSQLSGTGSKVPIEALAQDTSRSAGDRARDIADAFNRAGDPYRYFKFRDEQMSYLEQHFRNWDHVDPVVRNLWEASTKHTHSVKELAQAGDDALLKTAPRLQGTEAELRLRRFEVQKLLQSAIIETEKLKDTFSVLNAAEKQMHQLPESEKKYTGEALKALHQQGDKFKKLETSLPPESKDIENAVTHIHNAEIARAREVREAVAAAEAAGRKIKFNEYLQTGLATDAAVVAPKTARFTRKPKPVSA